VTTDTLWIGLGDSILGAGTILLLVMAMALVYSHGKYIPLWLADLGTVGAYSIRVAWSNNWPGIIAVALGLAVAAIIGWMVHRLVMMRFIDNHDSLSALLAGLGLSFCFQGISSLIGSGMSEHFPENALQGHWYAERLGFAIYLPDLVGSVGSLLLSALFFSLLRTTHLGTRIRATFSNRDLARSLGLPVSHIDRVVLGVTSSLVVIACFLYGNRFDLQPTMMFYPGLTAIAAIVTAGPQRPFLALFVAIGILVGETLVGLEPTLAPLQRAVPFFLLMLVLTNRSIRWRSFLSESRS
jgi:branched-chain amino acid transport system permease protein